MRIASALALLAFMVGLMGFVIWLTVANYQECRAHGFSVLYCASRR